ncbi:MAG: HAD family hydrolase [Eubacteriales bacterium]|nr:HAD family hydrolase [Lachnospiraceae bacterium]MDO5128224.1 HAD family hydrolase [Eubacteriales bacterium]
MKKGILFDLDGTLWDSSQAVVDSWNEALDKFTDEPYRVTKEMMQGFMGLTMEEIGVRFFCNETKERAKELMEICEKYENQYIESHGGILFEGVEDTLKKLKEQGYFLCIVSNCQEGYIEAFLKYHKLGQYIDDTENYGRTGRDKDYNIRLVVERNHLTDAVYVGDIMGDYNSTMKAGLPFIHAAYGFGTVPEGTPKIMDICELPEKVRSVLN